MNSPKEKAEQLVSNFTYEFGEPFTFDKEDGKKCALVVVDEIIFALKQEDNPQTEDYWIIVKQEIEQL